MASSTKYTNVKRPAPAKYSPADHMRNGTSAGKTGYIVNGRFVSKAEYDKANKK